jgi:hypothetical protein
LTSFDGFDVDANRAAPIDVFVSHASDDVFAGHIASALRARGLRVWFDDEQDTSPELMDARRGYVDGYLGSELPRIWPVGPDGEISLDVGLDLTKMGLLFR